MAHAPVFKLKLRKLVKSLSEEPLLLPLYKASFPASERAPDEVMDSRVISSDIFAVYNESNASQFVGLAWCLDLRASSGFAFLANVATVEAVRGQGIGAALLSMLIERYGALMTEVEYGDADPLSLRNRRLRFYQRCGFFANELYFYEQPSCGPGLPRIPMVRSACAFLVVLSFDFYVFFD